MSPINLEDEIVRAHNTTALPAEYTAPLEATADLNEFLTLSRQLSEKQRQRLSEILKKSESEKADAYRTLDLIRRQLNDLENSDSLAASAEIAEVAADSDIISGNETDQVAKILEGVRKRMRTLNETTGDLRARIQKLEQLKNELSESLLLSESEAITESHDETLTDVAAEAQ